MKIGILTLNQQLNYGGVLQSYALQRYLRNQGYDAEVITYWLSENNWYLYGHYWLDDSVPLIRRAVNAIRNECRKGFIFAEILRRRRTIQFIQRYIQMSEKVYRNAEELKAISGYDAIIIGSDQVWNPNWYGCPNPFLLGNIETGIKEIAYAPSFGVKEIPADLSDIYKSSLSQFSALSCREKRGVQIIEELTGRKADWVVDPTLLLTQTEWNQAFALKPQDRNHIFCYWLGDFSEIIPTLYRIAREQNKKIHLFLQDKFDQSPWNDDEFRSHWRREFSNNPHIILFRGAGPKEFLQQLVGASAVISDSFHALIFALIYQKSVRIIINSTPERDQMSDRMYDFCERINSIGCLSKSIEDSWMPFSFDNKILSEHLHSWIRDSKRFLKNTIAF